MRLEVTQSIAAPRPVVWEALTDWERQAEWMVDALAVVVVTPHRQGDGVTLRVPTRVVAVTVEDVMRVTAWRPPEYLEVVHLGRVIRGSGAFVLDETDGATVLTWWEVVDLPFGALGEWGGRIAAMPVLRRLFARSLRRFAASVESPARPRSAQG